MFVGNASKAHPELDLSFLRALYTDASGELTAGQITSPWDLYAVETLRDQHQLRIGEAYPTDVFVFGKGEPADPACTKVGGRPYWPADVPWPSLPDGSPRYFLAQFNFADSADIVGDAIAETLLVITANSRSDWLSNRDSLSFNWVLRKERKLLDCEIPSAIGNAGPFYGTIFRSADYPDAFETVEDLGIRRGYNLPILNGTKIGGIPHGIQSDIKGNQMYLCQLSSIQAAPDVAYPWVNQRQELKLAGNKEGIHHESNCAIFYDMGNLYFLANEEDGEASWHFESY